MSNDIKKTNTLKRKKLINLRVNELSTFRHEGIRLSTDEIFQKVADEFCLSVSTVKKAIKTKVYDK